MSVVPMNVMKIFFGSCMRVVFNDKLLVINVYLLLATILLAFSCCTHPHRGRGVSLPSTFVVNLSRTYTILPKLSHSNAAVTAKLVLKGSGTGLTRFSFLVIVPPVLKRTLLSVVGNISRKTRVISTNVNLLPLAINFLTTFVSNYITYG